MPEPTDIISPPAADFPLDDYLAAVAEQDSARDFAFTEVLTDVGGVLVREITLYQALILSAIGSPFLSGKALKTDDETAKFLWYLSPKFIEPGLTWFSKKRSERRRRRFIRAIPPDSYPRLRAGIEAYLNRVFMDAPEQEQGKDRISYASFVAGYIDIFASQYHWSRREILVTPLAQLFQLMREMIQRIDSEAALINRWTDAVKDKFISSAPKLTAEQMAEIRREALANAPPQPNG